jgi:hypothetical protein
MGRSDRAHGGEAELILLVLGVPHGSAMSDVVVKTASAAGCEKMRALQTGWGTIGLNALTESRRGCRK